MNIKNALIVGGTDGIGAALALELYKQGVKVVVIGRSQEKANQLLRTAQTIKSGGLFEVIVCDLKFFLKRNSVIA
ncbi:MAG: SDR family NAD(P)-dependent oxidoreductase [Candidatus Kapaibacteriota bacterium]